MDKHTPGPWFVQRNDLLDIDVVRGAEDKAIAVYPYRNLSHLQEQEHKANAARIVECVNACEGQSIETVKLATAHRDACMHWETLMMRKLGEDGLGTVEIAIDQLKDQNKRLRETLQYMVDSFATHMVTAYTDNQRDSYNDAYELLTELKLAEQKGGQDEPA